MRYIYTSNNQDKKPEKKHSMKQLITCENCHCQFKFDGNYARTLCDFCQSYKDEEETT